MKLVRWFLRLVGFVEVQRFLGGWLLYRRRSVWFVGRGLAKEKQR